jgi:hypothetical protein
MSGSIPKTESSVVLREHLTSICSISMATERKEIISFNL